MVKREKPLKEKLHFRTLWDSTRAEAARIVDYSPAGPALALNEHLISIRDWANRIANTAAAKKRPLGSPEHENLKPNYFISNGSSDNC